MFCTRSVLELFFPVTEPIRAAGMGEMPRLGDRLGLEKAVEAPASSWAPARRRLRGRMDAVSESRPAGRSVLEEEVREGIIASGMLPTGPWASTRGRGNDSGWASDRGGYDNHGTVRFMTARCRVVRHGASCDGGWSDYRGVFRCRR